AARYGILDDNVLSVIALNAQSILEQVAINS
ncbi:YfcE family phosphodiesterase, partial [Salmonella enterica subsp. enterica serovar Enteritidis]|nr:YfcE family phosphodiesterase [Salmonella enterica subsp. enterica serovar Enteritidis]